MDILVLDKAQKELYKFPREVQAKFDTQFIELSKGGKLDNTKFKKLLGINLFEFRVKFDSNIYRGIGADLQPSLLITLFFIKKTQKIPSKELKKALSRYKNFISKTNNEK